MTVTGWEFELLSDEDEDAIVERLSELTAELETGGFEHEAIEGGVRVRWAPSATGCPDESELRAALDESGLVVGPTGLRPHVYEDVDWSTHWRHHFRTLQAGPLWVVPSWEEAPAEAEHVLRLDPGMAFGTGLHPTTRLCLTRLVEMGALDRLLDVGTGSGILALASLKLGTAEAVGVDVDRESLRVAQENAQANGLTLKVAEPPSDVHGAFAVVVANILAEPLIAMAGELTRCVAPEGRLLLSGLLTRQADGVQAAYEKEGLTWVGERREGEWSLLDFTASGV